MSILAAIKREEKKVQKKLSKLQHQLSGLQAAAKAMGDSTSREPKGVKKRVMSVAGRAKIAKAAKNAGPRSRRKPKRLRVKAFFAFWFPGLGPWICHRTAFLSVLLSAHLLTTRRPRMTPRANR
jgi:hypothetical protein